MRIRHLLVLPLVWLTFCGFVPIPFIAAAAFFGAGMAATDGTTRPKPWVKPHQVMFGQAIDRTTLNMRLVTFIEPQGREMALLRMRAGYEPAEGVYAIVRLTTGLYAYVHPRDIIWE